jgi:hypothetical protein
MSTRKVFLPEIMRVWAQWIGLGLAAIPAGLILGILEQRGINEKAARAVALVIGFVLAITFWILIARWIAVRPIEYTTGVCPAVISLEPAYPIVAVALLCVTISVQPATGTADHAGANPVSGHAIS